MTFLRDLQTHCLMIQLSNPLSTPFGIISHAFKTSCLSNFLPLCYNHRSILLSRLLAPPNKLVVSLTSASGAYSLRSYRFLKILPLNLTYTVNSTPTTKPSTHSTMLTGVGLSWKTWWVAATRAICRTLQTPLMNTMAP